MAVSATKQFIAVLEYEVKQALYSKRALLAFGVICSFFFILLYWLYQLQTALLNRESVAEARIAEKFREIVIESFYESYPFLAECPFYVTILQFYFLICISVLAFILIADIATHELRDRTFRYFAFRINLKTVMIGKFVAYTLQFSMLSMMMWAVAIGIFEGTGMANGGEGQWVSALRYAFHFWFIDHAIWMSSIATSMLASILFKNPYIAMAFFDIGLVYLFANRYTKDFAQATVLGLVYPISAELMFSMAVYAAVTFLLLSVILLIMSRREL